MDNQFYKIEDNSNFSSNLYSNYKHTEDYFKGCYPMVNYTNKKDIFIIDIFVPGFEKKDLRISIDNGILRIKGDQTYSDSHFQRNIKIPGYVDQSKCYYQVNCGHVKIYFPTLR